MSDYVGVWRSPVDGKIYRGSAEGSFEAQIILPEDIEAIKAQVVLEEVLGLARSTWDPTPLGLERIHR